MGISCKDYIDYYIDWLKENFVIEKNGDVCHIITPFLRPDKDHIEIYIDIRGDYIELTDNGRSIEYLFLTGIDIERSERKMHLIDSITKSYGVEFNGYELVSRIKNIDEFAFKFNNLIFTIESMINLRFAGQERGKEKFKDLVLAYLKTNGINIDEKKSYKFQGYSAEYNFNYVVPKVTPIIIQPLSVSNNYYANIFAKNTAFQWNDLRRNAINFKGIALIDDIEFSWDEDSITILERNSDYVIPWSKKKDLIEIIAA